MSEFLIFSSIPVLVVVGGIGEGDDDECWSVGVFECWIVRFLESCNVRYRSIKSSEFSECCRTSASDRDIGVEDEVREILLRDPVEELDTTSPQPSPKREGVFEIHSHIGIEFPENENHLMIFQNCFKVL